MKILYLANKPEPDGPLGACPNWYWIQESMKQLGHVCRTINESSLDADEVHGFLKDERPDILLTEEARLEGDFENDQKGNDIVLGLFKPVLEIAKKRGILVVPWITNIFFGIMRREVQVTTNPIFKADVVFSTDGGHDKEFKEAGVNHVTLRQGIYGPESVLGTPFDTKVRVAFIGSIYEEIWPYRRKLVDWLGKTYGDRFQHTGKKGELRHQALNDYLASVPIIVGDSVYSPEYFSNRIYEVVGRGGFIIHPMVPGLEKEFTPYKHFVPYDFGDFDGLKEKIDYFLAHEDERKKIAMAGMKHCQKHHTYLHRVVRMMDVLVEQQLITFEQAFPKGRPTL